MGRQTKVREALFATELRLRRDIEELHEKNLRPSDYSLGFTNGVIFCTHNYEGKIGKPKFYDHVTSIGELPKPVTFRHQVLQEAEHELKLSVLTEKIIERARDAIHVIENGPYADPKFTLLLTALQDYDQFLDSVEAKINPPGAAPGVGKKTPSQEQEAT